MTAIGKLLYNLNRIALILLALAFGSFLLLTVEGFDFVAPIAANATKYLPILLIPVTIGMIITLLIRYMLKGRTEKINFGDYLAGLIAIVLQLATIITYRSLGNEIAGQIAVNIPNVDLIVEQVAPMGMTAVFVLQVLAALFYWFADPDPKRHGVE